MDTGDELLASLELWFPLDNIDLTLRQVKIINEERLFLNEET
jgi:hypothetical protein